MKLTKAERRQRIHYRIRKTIKGTAEVPRLSVYRSNKAIYCQLIDDVNGMTLGAASSQHASVDNKQPKIDQAKQVGKLIGEAAVAKNISSVLFDRAGYLYHGRVKALADGAREAGLKF